VEPVNDRGISLGRNLVALHMAHVVGEVRFVAAQVVHRVTVALQEFLLKGLGVDQRLKMWHLIVNIHRFYHTGHYFKRCGARFLMQVGLDLIETRRLAAFVVGLFGEQLKGGGNGRVLILDDGVNLPERNRDSLGEFFLIIYLEPVSNVTGFSWVQNGSQSPEEPLRYFVVLHGFRPLAEVPVVASF